MRAATSTLINEAFGLEGRRSLLRDAAIVLGATGLLALSAKVQVPFYPVPMTLQSLVILVVGAAFGWRMGVATVLAYLAEGAAGIPVFAGAGAGPAYMMGPTGGYLAGFVLAAAFTGFMAERGYTKGVLSTLVVMTIGHALVFAPGYLWLTMLFGAQKAYVIGVAPFYAATVLKTALGAALLPAAWWALERVRRA